MAETISKIDDHRIIGGAFSKRENADAAVEALQDLGVPESDIQVVVMLNGDQACEACNEALDHAPEEGSAEWRELFLKEAANRGKVLVAVHNVTDPAPVIAIFDENQAEYNADGSRNIRQDVVGLTAGAAMGAAAGGLAGTAGGPLGCAIGAVAGAMIGGGAGGAVGMVTEHQR